METTLSKNEQKKRHVKKRNKVSRRKDSWQLYLMLIPAILVIAIFNYGPLGGLVMAFQDYKPFLGIKGSEWIGLEHFKFLFEYEHSRQVIWNTLRFSALKLVFGMFVTISFAVLINEVHSRLIRYPVQSMVFLPHFLSWVVLGGVFSEMLNPGSGLVNQMLGLVGIDPIFFLGENNWFVTVVVATDVWKGFGYGSIIYLASMAGINPALYEAAKIDGAGRFKQIWHITLPALAPVISIVLALNLSQMLSADFDQIFNMYNPLVYEKGDIIDTFVYRVGLVDGNYGFATAVGLFKSVVGLILIVGSFKISSKLTGSKVF